MHQKKRSDFYDMYREENSTFVREYDERMKKINGKKQSRAQAFTIRLFILLLVSGIGAALVGTLYFSGTSNRIDPLEFELRGESSLKSGQHVSYQVHIRNRGSVPLADLALNVEYPQGFHFEQSSLESTNADHTYWKLPTLGGGASSVISLEGTLVGVAGDEKRLRAILHYRIGENGTEFVSKKEYVAILSDQLMPIALKGPTLVEPAREAVYTITYENIQDSESSDVVRIQFTAPKEFAYTADPAQDGNGYWSNELLAKRSDPVRHSGSIELKGSFGKNASGEFDFIAQIGTKKNNEFVISQEQKISVRVVKNPLSLSVSVGDGSPIQPVSFGALIPIVVRYENTGMDALTNITLSVSSNSPYIDWSRLGNDSLAWVKDSAIEWSFSDHQELELLQPQHKGELKLQMAIKDSTLASRLIESDTRINSNLSIPFTVQAGMTILRSGEETEIANEPYAFEIPLNSDTRIMVSANSFDSSSRLTIQCDVENTLHEIKNLKIALPLGPSAKWAGTSTRSAGDVSYDKEKNVVVWTLNRMPLSVKRIYSTFTIHLSSVSTEMDDDSIIIQPATLDALDGTTAGTIHLNAAALTTAQLKTHSSNP